MAALPLAVLPWEWYARIVEFSPLHDKSIDKPCACCGGTGLRPAHKPDLTMTLNLVNVQRSGSVIERWPPTEY